MTCIISVSLVSYSSIMHRSTCTNNCNLCQLNILNQLPQHSYYHASYACNLSDEILKVVYRSWMEYIDYIPLLSSGHCTHGLCIRNHHHLMITFLFIPDEHAHIFIYISHIFIYISISGLFVQFITN